MNTKHEQRTTLLAPVYVRIRCCDEFGSCGSTGRFPVNPHRDLLQANVFDREDAEDKLNKRARGDLRVTRVWMILLTSMSV